MLGARSWIFLLARRCAQRSGERRERWESAPSVSAASPAGSQPGQHLEVVELLGHLDVEKRSAFVLTRLLGLSYAEAAAVAECPVGTIRSRVARARGELVEALREEGRSSLGA